MDPLTQASVGAAVAACFCRRAEARRAILLGALAGAAPDLDVLIRSEADPLLSLQYHRHFSHALLVAPMIGLIVAALFRALFFWKPWPFRRLALFAVAGAWTHGLIDACTSYGTHLYWPLSDYRESWDIISIIDPLFTLPLVLLTVIAFALRRPRAAQIAVAVCCAYLSFGLIQRERAQAFAVDLAATRGHTVDGITARPSFGNLFLWRMVYRSGGFYYVDAVRCSLFSPPIHYPGGSVCAFTPEMADAYFLEGSQQAADVARFRVFSQGFLYWHPTDLHVLGDVRYAMFPDSIQPLWGVRVDPSEPRSHVSLEHFREPSGRNMNRLWSMIWGEVVEPLPPVAD